MQTLLLDIKKDENAVKLAAKIIKDGGLVAFPTETVYGLGANALDEKSCKKIYEAKGRPSDNPIIVHVANEEMAEKIAFLNDDAKTLMKHFSPGPLTYILKAKDEINETVRGGLKTVGVRIPSNKVAHSLIKEANLPIAAPSANISGRPSPTRAKDVIFDLENKIDCILIDENTSVGLESTIVDVSSPNIKILRPGIITKEEIEKVLKKEVNAINIPTKELVAPGMKYRHYAPEARLIIVSGEEEKVVNRINELTKKEEKVGVICCDETYDKYKSSYKVSLGSRKDYKTIAKNLFLAFRCMNELEVNLIYCESFKRVGVGEAIMNRLIKAANDNIMTL